MRKRRPVNEWRRAAHSFGVYVGVAGLLIGVAQITVFFACGTSDSVLACYTMMLYVLSAVALRWSRG